MALSEITWGGGGGGWVLKFGFGRDLLLQNLKVDPYKPI